jgi:DNA-binding MarR family transcriptional regulator
MNQHNKIKSLDPTKYKGFLLWQKANNWEKYINNILKPYETTQSEIFLLISLSVLADQVVEVTQVKLVDFTDVSPMSISKTLKILEKKKLILRKTGKDTRSKSLQITSLANKLLMQTAPILFEADKEFFPKDTNSNFFKYLQSLE